MRNTQLKKNPPTFWAWLAGFIDGDGSISSYQRKHGQPVWMIQIAQKNKDILELIVDSIGVGSIHPQNQEGRVYWALSFGSRATRLLCEKIQEHLRDAGKKARAGEAILWRPLKSGEFVNSPEKNPAYEKAIALYATGIGPAEISRALLVPPGTIHNWIVRAGVQRPQEESWRLRGLSQRGKEKVTANSEARKRAIALRESGRTQASIASELGVHINTVRYWLKVASKRETPECPSPTSCS